MKYRQIVPNHLLSNVNLVVVHAVRVLQSFGLPHIQEEKKEHFNLLHAHVSGTRLPTPTDLLDSDKCSVPVLNSVVIKEDW